MDRSEIGGKIPDILNKEHKGGLRAEELRREIGISDRKSTDARNFYRELPSLVSRDEVEYHEEIKVYYLKQHESEVWLKWKLFDPDLIKDSENIKCGFILIEQGVITQKKGAYSPFKEYVLDDSIPRSGFLDRFVDTKDDSDFLYFWIENGNNHTIEDVVARIYVPPLFHPPMKPRDHDCYKCRYNVDYYNITIQCDKLIGSEKGMSNDRAYALIPLKRKNLDDEYDKEEFIPKVKVRYKDVPIRHIKGAEVTADTTKGDPFFIPG